MRGPVGLSQPELQAATAGGRHARGDVGEARGEVHVPIHGVVAVIGIAKVVTAQRVSRRLGLQAGDGIETRAPGLWFVGLTVYPPLCVPVQVKVAPANEASV